MYCVLLFTLCNICKHWVLVILCCKYAIGQNAVSKLKIQWIGTKQRFCCYFSRSLSCHCLASCMHSQIWLKKRENAFNILLKYSSGHWSHSQVFFSACIKGPSLPTFLKIPDSSGSTSKKLLILEEISGQWHLAHCWQSAAKMLNFRSYQRVARNKNKTGGKEFCEWLRVTNEVWTPLCDITKSFFFRTVYLQWHFQS